jgi:hypothetical protein
VHASEALLDPVWVPGQVVIHHEVSGLKVDALSCNVCRYEDENVLVSDESLLHLATFLAWNTAMDRNDGLLFVQASPAV